MIWERPELPRFPVTPFYAVAGLLLISAFVFLRDTPVASQADVCSEQGGEWLHGSVVPTCILKSGEWLVFDESVKETVKPEVAGVASAPAAVAPNSIITCDGTFIDYPIEGVMAERGAAVDFASWPDAVKYRSAINRDYARGANFADHYVVSSWGCPDFRGCEGYAVIDTSNGKILSYGETSFGTDFNKESRLLVVNTTEGEDRYLLHPSTDEFGKCN